MPHISEQLIPRLEEHCDNPGNPFRLEALLSGMPFSGEPIAPVAVAEPGELDLDSVDSILMHAEHVPTGWAKAPLARLIRRRIELGIDSNIHDATYWLSEFECPETVEGDVLYDTNGEMKLVAAALFGEDPAKLPTSDTKISALFTSDVRANAYKAIRAGNIANASELFKQLVEGELGETTGSDADLYMFIREYQNYARSVSKDDQSQLLEELNGVAERRARYNRQVQAWVQSHGTSPREKLVRAWKVRSDALSDGAADNPNAILTWERTVGLNHILAGMEQEGVLSGRVGAEELEQHSDFVSELLRVYDGRTVIRALEDFLHGHSPETVFPATSMHLSDGSRVEVLAKDDPRNFTVGGDTRCCMTPTGLSRACIEAAYSDPRVSILALYDPTDNLAAHSVLFTNPDEAPGTIVIDNIETNKGRDRNRIAELYQEFFELYIQHDELAAFDTVNLGMHFSERYRLPLDAANVVSSVIDYSDAQRQAVLYERKPALGSEFVPTSGDFTATQIELERAIYGGMANGGTPILALETGTQAPSHSYSIRGEDGEAIGYVIAYEAQASQVTDESVPDEIALYIDDLAVLPGHRARGYGRKALEGMLTLAGRIGKPLLFHAHEHTSRPILEAKQAELEQRGFAVETLAYEADYYQQGVGAYLMKIAVARS